MTGKVGTKTKGIKWVTGKQSDGRTVTVPKTRRQARRGK